MLDKTKQDGKLFANQANAFVTDYSLPLLAAIPTQEAARIAVETAQMLDRRVEYFLPSLL